MSWRLQISHRTGFSYAGPVTSSYNEARMSPPTEAHQSVLDAHVTVWPAARTFSYRDYWDTQVTVFDVHTPHEKLEVVADALVETANPDDPSGASLEWSDLDQTAITDRWAELLLPTPRTALDDDLTALAKRLRAEGDTPESVAAAICALVNAEIAYVPGSTGVQTDAVQVWRQREGVCQDISHLSIGLLRATGQPARYVSGYFYPNAEGVIGDAVVGQSHAWVEWLSPDGWRGFDPTNGIPIGERHVVLGRGRDYGDVPPLKGLYAGPPSTAQTVDVTLTRLR
jgi:transglutaminase-like putative cysteine protease